MKLDRLAFTLYPFTCRCVEACLSNEATETQFFALGDYRMSSSLRKLSVSSTNPAGHPNEATEVSTRVKTTRYDDWKRGIPRGLLPTMNTLVVDVQGMDYEVLEGMGEELAQFEVLLIEVSSAAVYQGQRLAHEVDEFLFSKGFSCHDGCAPCAHCDRLYRRGDTDTRQKAQTDAISDATSLLTGSNSGGFFPCCSWDGTFKNGEPA